MFNAKLHLLESVADLLMRRMW